ncbi:MAG TPA: TetR/AcrR family transcriptional regulator [Puia sp.]|nr:TetR/AcrR family transcriptional regulator [Puia sp.]
MDAKERILQKANDLFMRYGIRSITMDEIAAQLGISKKTIYQYFTDKDEMVAGVIDNHIRDNEEKCKLFKSQSENAIQEIFIAVDETEEMLKVMNPLIMYDLEKHHLQSHRKFRDHIYRFMYQMVKENLQRGITEELYRPELNLDIVAKHRLESAFMCFNQDVFPHSRYKISEVCRELAMLYIQSVATQKGKKLIDKYSTERTKHLSHEQ